MENKTTRNAEQTKSTDSSNDNKKNQHWTQKKCKYIVSGMIISMMIMMIMMLIVKTRMK